MFNMMKMNLYQMFKTRSMYVVWLCMALIILFTTSLQSGEGELFPSMDEPESAQENMVEDEGEYIQIGMSVDVPTEPGERVTVFDEVYANVSAKFIALMMGIFAVIFSLADMGSGYIKNIGGQVRRRRSLILSKAVALFVFTAITMLGYVVIQAVSNALFWGHLKWGNVGELLAYTAVQILLHFSLVMICMAISVICRSKTLSIIAAIFLCMNIVAILYGVIDRLLWKIGAKDFTISKYTVTGKIALFPMSAGRSECLGAVTVGVAFLAVMAVIACAVFEKRDI